VSIIEGKGRNPLFYMTKWLAENLVDAYIEEINEILSRYPELIGLFEQLGGSYYDGQC